VSEASVRDFVAALGLDLQQELAGGFRLASVRQGRRVEVTLVRGDAGLKLYLEPPGAGACYARTRLFRVSYQTPEWGSVPTAVVDAFVRRLAAAEARLPPALVEALHDEPPPLVDRAARPLFAEPSRAVGPVRRPLAILGQTEAIPRRTGEARLRITLANVCEEAFGYGPAASEYLRAKLLSVPEIADQVDVSILFLGGTDCEAFAEQIAAQEPDLVGFTCYSWNLASTAETTRRLRQKTGGRATVVWGGTSFAMLRERHDWFTWWSDVDAVAVGSGEQTIVDLVTRLLARGPGRGLGDGAIRGTMRSVDGRLLIGEPARVPASLEEVPSPYQMGTAIRVERPFIEMARGCLFQCAFCSDARVSREGRWLTASVDRIAKDVAAVVAWPGTTDIPAGASTANMSEAVFAEMCEGIRRGDPGQKLSYGLQIYPSIARPSLREALRGVRVRRIGIGVQSLTPETWRPMRRKTSIEDARKAVGLLSDLGTIYITVLLGMPGETYQSFVDMVEELLTIEGCCIVVHRLLILPGTQFHQQHERWGFSFDPDLYYRVLSSSTMSNDDLRRAQLYVRNRSVQAGFGAPGELRLDWTNSDDMPLSFDSPTYTSQR
jgi:radical SAM superfamily enzyme YgiQ (UPF0313 family)